MMSKRHLSFLSFLLIFSSVIPIALAQDAVALKNLSWEEQKDKTRIILETSKPLIYNVVASQNSSEVLLELANLDLKNLPQELFINTDEVFSLQTFPQSSQQKARLVIKMTAVRPHHVSAEGNTLYVDVIGNPNGDGLLAPVTTSVPPQEEKPIPELEAIIKEAEKNAIRQPEPAPVEPQKPVSPPPAPMEKMEVAEATEVTDIQIEQTDERVDVALIGNGTFRFDHFELDNPKRIVIDLQSVAVSPGLKKVVGSGHEMFSKIRVAQFKTEPKVARAVIDLNRDVPYTVVPSDSGLHVILGEKAEQLPSAEVNHGEPVLADKPPVQIAPSDPLPVSRVAYSPEAAVEKPVPEKPAAGDNEQFFSFQPDTSLFAQPQDTGSATQTPPSTSQPELTESQGLGQMGERTIGGAERQYTGEPFSFDFKDIDIKDLFRFIADISGLNVILDPSVSGKVTLKLTEVPWDQALDLITKNQGLGYTIEGNVIRIAPLAVIKKEEADRLELEKQKLLAAPIVTKIKPLSYAQAGQIQGIVKSVLTQKGSVIIDPRTNTLIVTDIDTNIDAVINLIDILDSRTAQVIIEARIVETTKNFSQAFGIQWGFRGIVDPAFGNNTTLQFPNNVLVDGSTLTSTAGIAGNPLSGYAVNLPTTQAPNSALLLSAGNILDTFRLDLALMALENTGNGRVISSPKVATQNNTRAEILQGTQIPVQTIANNTITTTFVNAALRMSVTPQITAEGTVILQVEVENNRPDFGNVVFGTPPIITERAQTTLLVEDGGTTVIGGIFSASDNYAQGRTPILHRIPLLGWLFKNTNVIRENRELLIFLTPRILR